jgi:hypothetical protein
MRFYIFDSEHQGIKEPKSPHITCRANPLAVSSKRALEDDNDGRPTCFYTSTNFSNGTPNP